MPWPCGADLSHLGNLDGPVNDLTGIADASTEGVITAKEIDRRSFKRVGEILSVQALQREPSGGRFRDRSGLALLRRLAFVAEVSWPARSHPARRVVLELTRGATSTKPHR